MRKIRGFKIGKRLVRISRWFIRKARRTPRGYRRLTQAGKLCKSKTFSKLISWGRRLTKGAKSICSVKPRSGYVPIGQEPFGEKPNMEVPKGHLAVYVGNKDGDFHRVLVPVIYFNHPLFSELLREAEKEYGYSHQGGITIPCRYSEFEKVQTRIAAGTTGARYMASWRRHH